MDEQTRERYRFGGFEFDASGLVLYFDGKLVTAGEGESGKTFSGIPLKILAALLRHRGDVVTYNQIIEAVWNSQPAYTKSHIPPHVTKLRTILEKYEPDSDYIKPVDGRGYVFAVTDVERTTAETSSFTAPGSSQETGAVSKNDPATGFVPAGSTAQTHQVFPGGRRAEGTDKARASKWQFITLCAITFLSILGVSLWWSSSGKSGNPSDEAEIRRVVEDSQKYESLILYKQPSAFDERELAKYWLPQANPTDEFDIMKVREGAQKLAREGRYYGDESRCEQFDFVSIEVNEEGNYAVVKTIEKWLAAKYQNGSKVEDRLIGPYSVTYVLRKKAGKWLIEKSNTARAARSPAF